MVGNKNGFYLFGEGSLFSLLSVFIVEMRIALLGTLRRGSLSVFRYRDSSLLASSARQENENAEHG